MGAKPGLLTCEHLLDHDIFKYTSSFNKRCAKCLNVKILVKYLDVLVLRNLEVILITLVKRNFCSQEKLSYYLLVLKSIVIRYKVFTEQHPRAGLNKQHVIYKQLAKSWSKY